MWSLLYRTRTLLRRVASFKYIREPENNRRKNKTNNMRSFIADHFVFKKKIKIKKDYKNLINSQLCVDLQLSSTCLLTSSSAGKTWLIGARKVCNTNSSPYCNVHMM